MTSASASRACGQTDPSVTSRYPGARSVGTTIDAVGFADTADIVGAPSGSRSRLRSVRAPFLRQLPGEAPEEARVVPDVALPQPAWLVRKPVRPLEPCLLHPVRGLWNEAGMEVERRP